VQACKHVQHIHFVYVCDVPGTQKEVCFKR
jgi:hypothetical protein